MPGKFLRLVLITFFSLLSLLPVSSWGANQLEGVRIWPSPDSTRVVLDLSQKPSFKHFSLSKPDRLVVDLSGTATKILGERIKTAGAVTKLRTGKQNGGALRVVLELNQAIQPNIFALKPIEPYGHRLVIDLPHSKSTATEPPPMLKRDPDVIIAIDAGHGGEDPGSIGPRKTYEKNLTMEMSRRLKKLIDKEPGMRAVLTRTSDYYVGLNKRSELARKSRADLMISVHADAFTNPKPRGASVWVLSNRRANTEIGRWMEKQDERSEFLGGAGTVSLAGRSDSLKHMLLDLQMGHSQRESVDLASGILSEMGRVTRLHKKEPEHASLAVLKSPDIPSILIEVGFISNPTEEKLLLTRSHQEKVVGAIFKGIKSYVQAKPPEGTLLAQNKADEPREYTVKNGDSLSRISKQYNVTIAALKKANNLRSDTVRLGQKLVIPL